VVNGVHTTSIDQELTDNTEQENVMKVVYAELESEQQPRKVELQDSMQQFNAEFEYQQSCEVSLRLLSTGCIFLAACGIS